MKQEEEPWIDHLKQRVNEYEKPGSADFPGW